MNQTNPFSYDGRAPSPARDHAGGTSHANGHASDEMIDSLYSYWPGLTPAPQPCPEAIFSCTMEGLIDGHKVLLTARGMTAAAFKANLQSIAGLLDPVQGDAQRPTQASSQEGGWCRKHNCAMKENEKDGRRWFSHQVDGQWCKGK
jgi:hypothetical protein